MNNDQVRVGVGVFIFKDGRFLLQKRQGSHGEGTWSIPGGHLEYGESFEETAKREVYEETGLRIRNVRFGALTNDILADENKHYVSIWLLSDYESGKEHIVEPDKCAALEWSTFDTLPAPLAPWWNQLFESEFLEKIKLEAKAIAG